MSNIGVAGITFREMRLEELVKAADLRLEMKKELDGEDLDAYNPGWRERFVAFFGKFIESGRGAVFCAEENGHMIAMTAVYELVNHRSEIYKQQSAYITNVYVVPAKRRHGIAARLTQQAVDWARARKCVIVRLRTSPMGRPVYTGLGFAETDELELELRS